MHRAFLFKVLFKTDSFMINFIGPIHTRIQFKWIFEKNLDETEWRLHHKGLSQDCQAAWSPGDSLESVSETCRPNSKSLVNCVAIAIWDRKQKRTHHTSPWRPSGTTTSMWFIVYEGTHGSYGKRILYLGYNDKQQEIGCEG